MVDFPAREERAVDLPFVALAIRSKNERAFARAHQNSNLAHDHPFEQHSFRNFDNLQRRQLVIVTSGVLTVLASDASTFERRLH